MGEAKQDFKPLKAALHYTLTLFNVLVCHGFLVSAKGTDGILHGKVHILFTVASHAGSFTPSREAERKQQMLTGAFGSWGCPVNSLSVRSVWTLVLVHLG